MRMDCSKTSLISTWVSNHPDPPHALKIGRRTGSQPAGCDDSLPHGFRIAENPHAVSILKGIPKTKRAPGSAGALFYREKCRAYTV
jgi:hypothetical protein